MFDKDIITSHCSYKPPFCTIFLQRKTNNLNADSQDFLIVPKRSTPDRAVFYPAYGTFEKVVWPRIPNLSHYFATLPLDIIICIRTCTSSHHHGLGTCVRQYSSREPDRQTGAITGKKYKSVRRQLHLSWEADQA